MRLKATKFDRSYLGEILTRRELADLLDAHADRITHWRSHDGLGSAVAAWDRQGRASRYSRVLALRWRDAYRCRRGGDRPCRRCRVVLEDFRSGAAHLTEAGHGAGACAECYAPWLTQPVKHGN